MVDVEDLVEAAGTKPVSFCRCFKSATFPYCNGSHGSHNEACGDNSGPLVVKP